MNRLSMNEMTTYRWSFEEDVSHYVTAGIPAIGVWRQKLSDFGEDKGIELLAEHQLMVSNLLWAGGFTGSDGRSHSESIEDGEEAIRLAAAMKAECLVLYTGGRGGHTLNHARRLITSALSDLAEFAAQFNIVLAVEPMHIGCAVEWTFLTDLDETLDVLDEVGSPHVKLVFDTYHLGHSEDVLTSISDVASRIAIVHLGDAKSPPAGEQNRCRLGEGDLPLKRIMAELSAGGYKGWFDVELMGEEIESQEYVGLIAHSKEAYGELICAATS